MNSKGRKPTIQASKVKSKVLFNWRHLLLLLIFAIIVLGQTVSLWFYQGPKVDEAEMVLYGVGFLGGELDPRWNGYGHLGMYLLGIMYFLIGCVSILLGLFSDFTEYGAHFLKHGYFFMLGRVFMASAIVIAIFLCLKILTKYKAQPFLLVMFFLLVSLSPSVVKYANYVRTDVLVTLFTICILYFSVKANNFRCLVWVAIFTAAAVACKISALSISGVLALLMGFLWLKKQVTLIQAIAAGVIFLLFTQLLSPHMDYLWLFKSVLHSETGEASNAYRSNYVGLGAKLDQIFQFHLSVVGKSVCSLAAVGLLIGGFTRYRRLVFLCGLLIFFTVLPYLFGSSLREYWFLSSYLLVALLAFIALLIVLEYLRSRLPSTAYQLVQVCTVIVIILLPLQFVVRTHIAYVDHHRNAPLTNKLLAQRWLEQEHLGVSSILIDNNFSNVYPRLFDPAYLRISRHASGMYGYNKDKNMFLSNIFEHFLYKGYLNDVDTSLDRSRFLKLKKLRLDFANGVSSVKTPRVCSRYSRNCYQLSLSGLHDIALNDQNSETMQIKVTGDDPYLVFDVDARISIDRSFYVEVESDAAAWKVFYDFGDGISEELSSRYYYKSGAAAIAVPSIKPIVNYMGVGHQPRQIIDVEKRVLFVTSESGYGRFYGLREKSIENMTLGEKRGFILLNWHDDITTSKLVRRFDGPLGSPIDIYDISEYSADDKSN